MAVLLKGAPAEVWRDGRLVSSVPSLVVHSGEVVALAGDNGAGKSSLLLGALGVLPSTLVCSAPRVGYQPQSLSVPSLPMTVAEYVRLVLSGSVSAAALEVLLGRVGLGAFRGRRLTDLSGGEQRRLLVTTAVAAAGVDGLLLLDEPAASLDVEAQGLVDALIVDARAAGAGILLVSHSVAQRSALADRVVEVTPPGLRSSSAGLTGVTS